MADAMLSKSIVERRVGSTPTLGTVSKVVSKGKRTVCILVAQVSFSLLSF